MGPSTNIAEVEEMNFRKAINEALREEMARDNTIIVMGEDVAGGGGAEHLEGDEAWGGPFRVTRGLVQEFGRERVIDTPLSEMGFIGAAVGAAMTGLRPVVELMFVGFIGVAYDPLLNQAAKLRYMFGGKAKVPMVLRTVVGAGFRAGPQHSQILAPIFASIPGLKVAIPSTPNDAKGLLIASIRDDNPVIFMEDITLYRSRGPVTKAHVPIPLGKADVKRAGTDVTVVASGKMVLTSLAAAETLASEGISIEVIDLRTIVPLDEETIFASVRKTERIVVVDENSPFCSPGSEVIARVAQEAFDYLDAPPVLISPPPVPVPFSPVLEDAYIPSEEKVINAVRNLLRSN